MEKNCFSHPPRAPRPHLSPCHKHHQQLSIHKFFLILIFFYVCAKKKHPSIRTARKFFPIFETDGEAKLWCFLCATLVQNEKQIIKSLIKINLCPRRKNREKWNKNKTKHREKMRKQERKMKPRKTCKRTWWNHWDGEETVWAKEIFTLFSLIETARNE